MKNMLMLMAPCSLTSNPYFSRTPFCSRKVRSFMPLVLSLPSTVANRNFRAVWNVAVEYCANRSACNANAWALLSRTPFESFATPETQTGLGARSPSARTSLDFRCSFTEDAGTSNAAATIFLTLPAVWASAPASVFSAHTPPLSLSRTLSSSLRGSAAPAPAAPAPAAAPGASAGVASRSLILKFIAWMSGSAKKHVMKNMLIAAAPFWVTS
mmetsp:Transcript_9507/g.26691  ORF Transcript_9507/g.26691 Transcript_9507/m.26691 type:complete len:213 (-) Transcript_9507:616-1254(-)